MFNIFKSLIIVLLIILPFFSFSQNRTVITDKPSQDAHPSAVLELISDDKGFLLPRMETDERDIIDDPAESLLIFNEETNCVEVYIQDEWHELWCSPVIPLYELNIETDPLGCGFVSGDGEYEEGEVVEIFADPNKCYDFAYWSGDTDYVDDPNSQTTNVTMPAYDITLIANFEDNEMEIPSGTFDVLIETTEEETEFKFDIDGAANFQVDWGDGTVETFNGTVQPTHDYGEEGMWTIELRGCADRVAFHTGRYSERKYAEMLRDVLTPVSDGVAGITSAEYMFARIVVGSFSATDFFDDLAGDVTNMTAMFGWSEFNQPIGHWDVSNVTSMRNMFLWSPFNRDISDWDVRNVTTTAMMFGHCSFVQDIGSWEINSLENMTQMFYMNNFNHDLSGWDVSNVTNMKGLFHHSGFDQDISGWDVSNVENFTQFLRNSSLSTENYNKLLIEWSNLNLQEDIDFNGGSSRYDLGLPEERRQYIIDTFNWSISDGGDTGNQYE